jgi:hypothetical protein
MDRLEEYRRLDALLQDALQDDDSGPAFFKLEAACWETWKDLSPEQQSQVDAPYHFEPQPPDSSPG